MTRPIVPACLNCHASGVAATPGTLNRFGNPPFREGGVACERCHGPGEAHIARMKADGTRDDIVNPAKLAPERRDSVCAQCHLSGEVRVMRPGASWDSYRAGDRLADSTTVFVRAAATPGMRVTSHFEKLAQSACKRASGDCVCGATPATTRTRCPAPRAAPHGSAPSAGLATPRMPARRRQSTGPGVRTTAPGATCRRPR